MSKDLLLVLLVAVAIISSLIIVTHPGGGPIRPSGMHIKSLSGNVDFFFPQNSVSGKIPFTVWPMSGCLPPDGLLRLVGVDTNLSDNPNQFAPLNQNFNFLKPVTLTMDYKDRDVSHLDEQSLSVYYCDVSGNSNPTYSLQIPTKLNVVNKSASAEISKLGGYGLLGKLKCPLDTAEYDDNYYGSKTIGNVPALYYDGPGTAPRIQGAPMGSANFRILDSSLDEDWFNFEAIKGKPYVVETLNEAVGVKTAVAVYDTDGTTLLDTGLGSIKWTPVDTKVVYVKVSPVPGSLVGCSATYYFRVTRG